MSRRDRRTAFAAIIFAMLMPLSHATPGPIPRLALAPVSAAASRPNAIDGHKGHLPRPWYQDAELTKAFLADLSREMAQLPFGARWPDAAPVHTDCMSYVGEPDELFAIRYWVYACDSRREGAIRTDYMYLLDGSEKPTLERVRYAIVAPPEARVEDWRKIQSALIDDLSAALEIPKWRDRDWEKIGIGRDRVVEMQLVTALPDTGKPSATSARWTPLSHPMADSGASYGHSGKPGAVKEMMQPIGGSGDGPRPTELSRRTTAVVESLVVYCFSQKLEAETRDAEWDIDREDSTVTPFSVIEYDRNEVIQALRAHHLELASVLDSTRATSNQVRAVDSAVSMARRGPAGTERDLVLYAAHLWAKRVVGALQGTPPKDCDGKHTGFVHEFNAAFSTRDRSRIECGHYGDWWYSGGFIDSVVTHAGANRWADDAFLDRTAVGWNLEYGCSPEIGTDEFRPVIARGEAFVKAHPSSWVVPEVRLLVAEAHETAWSLGKMFTGDKYIDSTVYAVNAPAHRTRAIELYELQLRERPSDPRNAAIRKRLARMRIDVDTGYREFWCSDD